MRLSEQLAILLASLVIPVTPALAQTVRPDVALEVTPADPPFPETMETARGMAMGLGARASAMGTSGLAYNAAGLSIGRVYHVDSTVTYEPQAARFGVGGSVVDSHSGPVNAGVNFRYVHGNGNSGHGGYDGRVGVGVPIGENFAIGAVGRYVSFWREGQSDVPPFAESVTLDAAIRVTPIPGLHFAALGYNLIPIDSSLIPLQVGGSASYTIDNAFTIAVDGLADLTSWENEDGSIRAEALIGVGAEYFTGEVPIRAGYIYDSGRDTHFLTAGVGWMNESVGIDIAWRQQLTDRYHTWLLASVRYFVH
jgi:hypothetical protein